MFETILQASEREIIWVMKFGIILVGILATIMALTYDSIYALWYLSSDLVYVILFPQLLCVVHMHKANTYGSVAGYVVGLLFRCTGGEKELHVPALIQYVGYEDGLQYFPFKTMSMLLSLFSIVSVSYGTDYLFNQGLISPEYDVFMCVINVPMDRRILKDPSMATSTDTLASAMHKVKYENGGNVNPLLLSANYNGGASGFSSTVTTPHKEEPSNSLHFEERIPLNAMDSNVTYDSVPRPY